MKPLALILASALGLALMTAIGAQAQTTQRTYDRNGNCNYSVTTYSDGSTRITTSTYDQNSNLTYTHTEESEPNATAPVKAPTPVYIRPSPTPLVVLPIRVALPIVPISQSDKEMQAARAMLEPPA